MKSCKSYKEKLPLFVYEELPEKEHNAVAAHLRLCPDCAADVAQLRALENVLPPSLPSEPDDATMDLLRDAISKRLHAEKPQGAGFWETAMTFLQPAPMVRIGFAMLIFVVGFLLGRQPFTDASAPAAETSPLQALFTASGEIQSQNGAINPLLAGVEKINYNPESGNMEIFYTTVNDVRLSGNLQNPAVQQMLREAILEEENPSVRLHAVKAVKALAEKESSGIDPSIIDALVYAMQKEENPGVRLKVVQALKAMLPDENAKYVLVGILLDDPNEALRIEALGALMSDKLSEENIGIFRKIARQDSNVYIQNRTSELIREYDRQPIPGGSEQ